MKHRNLSVGVFAVVASALLALCAPDYVKGAPSDLLKVRTNQCTYQLGTVRPKGSPNASWVLTVKDVAPGDGRACWVQLTRPTGNPLTASWIGCEAAKVLRTPRVCTWEWKGMTGKPKQYRTATASAVELSKMVVQWKPVP